MLASKFVGANFGFRSNHRPIVRGVLAAAIRTMRTMSNPSYVSEHYSVPELGERILAALKSAGKSLDSLSVDDLAPVDAFHIRGRAATEELARWTEVAADHRVLDVGSGIGGTSRYLASTVGCNVVGIDLTDGYCRVAEMLSQLVGLSDRTSFRQGSALDLPFEDDTFDVVWTEHVQMNVADKEGFYREIARVLRTDGRFACHDIFCGGGQSEMRFPVPWAETSAISHLIPTDEARAILADAGFEETRFEDKTEASKEFVQAALERTRTEGPMPVGLHLVLGDDAPIKFANLLENLEQGRVRVAQAVMRRT